MSVPTIRFLQFFLLPPSTLRIERSPIWTLPDLLRNPRFQTNLTIILTRPYWRKIDPIIASVDRQRASTLATDLAPTYTEAKIGVCTQPQTSDPIYQCAQNRDCSVKSPNHDSDINKKYNIKDLEDYSIIGTLPCGPRSMIQKKKRWIWPTQGLRACDHHKKLDPTIQYILDQRITLAEERSSILITEMPSISHLPIRRDCLLQTMRSPKAPVKITQGQIFKPLLNEVWTPDQWRNPFYSPYG